MKKKKIFAFFMFISLFGFILSTILINPLGDLDEIWNYNVARNIAKGLIPYKDISTITTPFLPMLNSIFLRFFADELIVMRILAAILLIGIFYVIYKILKNITTENNISFIMTFAIAILFSKSYCIDYNYMTLFLTLVLTYNEILKKKKCEINNNLILNDKNQILFNIKQGILAGLAVCTKQSIGFFVAIATVIYPFLEINVSKKEKIFSKQKMKQVGFRICGIAIPGILLVLYLSVTGAWNDFISYAVKGISTFSNSIPYNMLYKENTIIEILARILPFAIGLEILLILIFFIKDLKKAREINELNNVEGKGLTSDFKSIIKILTVYSLPMLIVIYPISDRIHFLIGSLMTWLEIFFIVFCVIKKLIYTRKSGNKELDSVKTKFNKISSKILSFNWSFIFKSIIMVIGILIFDFILLVTCNNLAIYMQEDLNQDVLHYHGIEISENLKERMKAIEEFTAKKESQGKKVYILDAEAAVYNIPIEKYTKNYDMFLKGNIGKDGEEGIIDKIKSNSENVIYLIKQDGYSLNWQIPTKVIDYVKNNFKKIENVDIFTAYLLN